MQGNICFSCGSENQHAHRFCTQCGTRLSTASKQQARLVTLNQVESMIYSLYGDKNTIGRDATNAVVLSDDQISMVHAAIVAEDGAYWLEDLGSRNGVYLNGRRITKREKLVEGGLIKLGSTIMRFELAGDAV